MYKQKHKIFTDKDILDLINNSYSLNSPSSGEDKLFWISQIPLLTQPQKERFYDILLEEKQKIEALEKQYEIHLDHFLNNYGKNY